MSLLHILHSLQFFNVFNMLFSFLAGFHWAFSVNFTAVIDEYQPRRQYLMNIIIIMIVYPKNGLDKSKQNSKIGAGSGVPVCTEEPGRTFEHNGKS